LGQDNPAAIINPTIPFNQVNLKRSTGYIKPDAAGESKSSRS
jgi:hypothetical protein